MAGGKVGDPILVEPAGVVRESVVSPTRQDELVAQSLEFIAANASGDHGGRPAGECGGVATKP